MIAIFALLFIGGAAIAYKQYRAPSSNDEKATPEQDGIPVFPDPVLEFDTSSPELKSMVPSDNTDAALAKLKALGESVVSGAQLRTALPIAKDVTPTPAVVKDSLILRTNEEMTNAGGTNLGGISTPSNVVPMGRGLWEIEEGFIDVSQDLESFENNDVKTQLAPVKPDVVQVNGALELEQDVFPV